MIIQRGRPTIQPLEVGYANSPKKAPKGGVCGVFPCVDLIQQPLRGDFPAIFRQFFAIGFDPPPPPPGPIFLPPAPEQSNNRGHRKSILTKAYTFTGAGGVCSAYF